MGDDSEIFALLFTQFQNGQINKEELSAYLSREREREEKKVVNLQETLAEHDIVIKTSEELIKIQETLIDKYIDLTNRNILEKNELQDKLAKMTIEMDNLKKEKRQCLPGLRKLLTSLRKQP